MLYVRHIAWLSATPEGDERSRGESLHEGGEGSPFLQLPPLDDEYYVIKMWEDCGSVSYGSSGIVPLAWTEIRAWRKENELTLSHFELSCIRKLSKEYVSEFYAAKSKNHPPPYGATDAVIDKVANGNRLRNMLRSRAKVDDGPAYEVV